MKKTGVAVVLVIVALFANSADALVLDFSDLTAGTSYNVGDSFVSSGAVVTGQEFHWLGGGSTTTGSATVETAGLAGGAGNELSLNNINLDFDFGAPLDGLALEYGYGGGNINIEINGDFANVSDMRSIPQNLGGTEIFTFDNNGSDGHMFVIGGQVNSFAIGGQELSVDNIVASVVPEPATVVLLGMGSLIACARRKRSA